MTDVVSIDFLRAIDKSLRVDAERAIALMIFFQFGNETETVESVRGSAIARGAILVRSACLESLVLTLSRMCDPGGSEKHSILRASEILSQSEVWEHFTQNGDGGSLELFMSRVAELRSEATLTRVKHLRDYRIAHSIPQKFELVDKLKYDDVGPVFDLTVSSVFALNKGVGSVDVTFDAVAEVWKKHNRAYWEKLTGTP
jgi:hypothetical protein